MVGERARPARFGRRDWLISFILMLATIQCVRADFLVNETFLDWRKYALGHAPLPYQGRVGMMPILRWAGDSAGMRAATARYAITVTIGTQHLDPITTEKFTSMLVGLVSLGAMMLTGAWWSRRRGLRPWWLMDALVLVIAAATLTMRATTNYWYAYDLPHAALFGMGVMFALEGWWAAMLLCFAMDVPMRETSLFLVGIVGALASMGGKSWLEVKEISGRLGWGSLLKLGPVALVGGMGMYWIVVRGLIARRFRGNVDETYPRMGQNLHELVFPHHWPQLLSAGGYMLVFVWLARRRLPAGERTLLYAMFLCFPITMWFGVWTETRVWLEWTLPVAALAATEVVDWIVEGRGVSRGYQAGAVL